MPSLVRDFAIAVANSLSCSLGHPSTASLAVLSTAIGNTRLVGRKDWKEPPVFWGALIGQPGSLKTPVLKAVTRPLKDIQEHSYSDFCKERQKYETQKQEYDQQAKVNKSQSKRKRKEPLQETEEEEIPNECFNPIEPIPPHFKRTTIDDATVESLAVQLSINPRGLGLIKDELSGWMMSFNQYNKGGSDVAKYLEAFNANTIEIDRKQSFPPIIRIPRAYLSILGGIQPNILCKLFRGDNTDNGLFSRFLFSFPPDMPVKLQDDRLSDEIQSQWSNLIWTIRYGLELKTNEFGNSEPDLIELDYNAWNLFHVVFEEIEQERTSELATFEEKTFLSKMRGYVLRIALILHTAKQAQREPRVFDPDERISEETLREAREIVWWYFGELREIVNFSSHQKFISEQKPLDEKTFSKVRQYFLRRAAKGESVDARGLRSSHRDLFATTQDAAIALDSLARIGCCTSIGGNSKRAYIWNTTQSV
ncbi:YfjI family protein [Planctomicrobium sp. SH527]|uniref:YfjI family protein n=1 Tax=Planctomicrobium sp. SH527 TaxID=3448123 RepID=UPI003F5AE600